MEDFFLEIHGYVYEIQGENQECRYSNECNCSYYGLGPQVLEGGCWQRGGDFFQRGWCNFHIKNNERISKNLIYLMTKKVYKQKDFFLL